MKMQDEGETSKHFQHGVLSWYALHRRSLPWRVGDTLFRSPYSVWVSEVMLQQTQVDRVVPYFLRWMRRWPTVQHLSRARRASVIRAWAGLGYNRRAVYLHKAARQVVSSYGGEFPRNEDELMKLPGVGKYTARAVLAFAYGEDVGVLETNTKRVLLRLFFGIDSLEELRILLEQEEPATSLRAQRSSQERAALLSRLIHQRFFGGDGSSPKFPLRQLADRSVSASPSKKSGASEPLPQKAFSGLPLERELLVLADAMVLKGKGGLWNQALMDFGALVCTAKQPKCEECPLRKLCRWYVSGRKQGMAKWSNGQNGQSVRFEGTDRYFRGRIVDALRRSAFRVDSLWKHMEMHHGLVSRKRFDRLLADLGRDGLVRVGWSGYASLP